MNIQNNFSIIIFLISNSFYAQILLEDITKSFKKSEDVVSYSLVNPDNFETTSYHKTKKDLSIYQFSSGFLLKDSLTISVLNSELHSILGGTIENESKNRLYFTDENFKSIYTYSFDLKSKKVDSIAHFQIPFNEYVTQIFEHKNAMYMLTISKDESWIRVYGFNDKPQPIVQTFSLDGFRVRTAKNSSLSFKDLIMKSNSFEFPYSIELIKPDFQPQLIQAAARRKMYVRDEKIYISFDFNPNQTSWIVLDLKEHGVRYHQTSLPEISADEEEENYYNSFLQDEFVFSIKKTSATLKIEILEFETNKVIKNFVGTQEKIDFRNTDLFYNPGNNRPFKLYKSSKPFFKKTKSSYWGIGVFAEKDGISITVGAVKENPNTSFLIGDVFLNGLIIVAGNDVGYEPILQNLAPYEFKSSFFESKLDRNFSHQLGELEPNAEHKINFFLSENPKAKNVFVFKRLSYYVLSYYDAKDNKIYYRKFD